MHAIETLLTAVESYLYALQTLHDLPGFSLTRCLTTGCEPASADITLPFGLRSQKYDGTQHTQENFDEFLSKIS